jgi:ribosomal protein L37AE/L43A
MEHVCVEFAHFVRDLMEENDSLWRCEKCGTEYTGRELAAWIVEEQAAKDAASQLFGVAR